MKNKNILSFVAVLLTMLWTSLCTFAQTSTTGPVLSPTVVPVPAPYVIPTNLPISKALLRSYAERSIRLMSGNVGANSIVYKNPSSTYFNTNYVPGTNGVDLSAIQNIIVSQQFKFKLANTNDYLFCWIRYCTKDSHLLFEGSGYTRLIKNGDTWTTPDAGLFFVELSLTAQVPIFIPGGVAWAEIIERDASGYIINNYGLPIDRQNSLIFFLTHYAEKRGELVIHQPDGTVLVYDTATTGLKEVVPVVVRPVPSLRGFMISNDANEVIMQPRDWLSLVVQYSTPVKRKIRVSGVDRYHGNIARGFSIIRLGNDSDEVPFYVKKTEGAEATEHTFTPGIYHIIFDWEDPRYETIDDGQEYSPIPQDGGGKA